MGVKTADVTNLPRRDGDALTQASVTVANASAATLAPADENRALLLIQNNGSNAIYVRFDGTDATTGTGFKLNPGVIHHFDGAMVTAKVTAIRASGSDPVIVLRG